MKDIEAILLERYNLKPIARDLNGPNCIVAQARNLMGIVAAPGHLDFSGKWIVRFVPSIGWCFQLGAMTEERFDSKDECIEYLNTQEANIYKKLYVYTLDVIKNMAKTVEEIENLDPTNRGEFMEVLK